ncbi:MAG: hypothetical protein KKH44_00620 [Bacteroidetes bacterium]|nr:hypothetical protein [Bacteroidota bacterium]
MTKSILLLLASVLLASCEVVETININPDNSGTIVVDMHRNENSYMQIAGEQYAKETIFKDTTYVFQDYIEKYTGNFVKYTATEQDLFNKYKNVKVHIKKSSFDKDFRTIISQDFTNVEELADLSKTENYISDIVHNYALTAEEHYYNIKYTFKDNQFNRVVTITNDVIFEREKKILESYNKIYELNLVQSYLLIYHFPRKIKSVSNANAIISSDRKSLELKFAILDFLKNPVSTNLEVVLE